MRRPAPIAVGAATLLIVLGLPFLRIEFTGVDASVLPRDQLGARRSTTRSTTEFPPEPHERRSTSPPGRRDAARRSSATPQRLGALPGVAAAPRVQPAGGL